MRAICCSCLVLVPFLVSSVRGQAPDKPAAEPKVEVKVVKYAELGEEVKRHKGKVIVVDFWMTKCIPCIREMPRLVQMHEKYGNKGFVAISVSVDEDAQNPKVRAEAARILQSRKVTFTSLILDEPVSESQKKLDFTTVPFIVVFNREGQWVRKFKDDDVNYDEIQKLVVELLGK